MLAVLPDSLAGLTALALQSLPGVSTSCLAGSLLPRLAHLRKLELRASSQALTLGFVC